MIKYRNNKIKPLVILLFGALTFAIMIPAVYFGVTLLTWELEGLICTFVLACLAIPIHIFSKRNETFYVVSWAINSVGIGLGVSSYYLYEEIRPDILQMVLSALIVTTVLAAACLLLYKFKESKKTIIIVSAVVMALLAVAAVIFWIINGAVLFSFGFFCLVEAAVWLYICGKTVNVNKRHILRDVSLGGFGVAAAVGVLVLALITEDDCGLEGIGELGEGFAATAESKKKKGVK